MFRLQVKIDPAIGCVTMKAMLVGPVCGEKELA